MPPADARMIAKLVGHGHLHVAKSKALLPLVEDKLKNSMQIPWSFHFYPYRASEASANTCRLCLMGCQV